MIMWPFVLLGEVLLSALGIILLITRARNLRNPTYRSRSTTLTLGEVSGEQWLRSAFRNTRVGVAIEGIEGKLMLANPALCSMLGYSEAELRGVHWRELLFGKVTGNAPWFLSDYTKLVSIVTAPRESLFAGTELRYGSEWI